MRNLTALHPLASAGLAAGLLLLATTAFAVVQAGRPAAGAPDPGVVRSPADGEKPKGKVRKGVVTASASLAPRAASPVPGGLVTVQVLLEMDEGWHIYANPAGDEMARPTVIAPEAKSPVKVLGVDYPEGTPSDAGGLGTVVLIYDSKVTIPVRVQLNDDVKPGPLELKLQVKFQPCNDTSCLAPASLSLPVKLAVQAP